MLRTNILILSFFQSFTLTLYERGIYFFLDERFGFTTAENLWVAVLYGVVYIGGALGSHPVAMRLGEKPTALGLSGGAVVLGIALTLSPTVAAVLIAVPLIAVMYGGSWPVYQSYLAAGLTGGDVRRAMGRFNLTWAVAVPLGVAASGPLISGSPRLLFLAAAGSTLVVLALAMTLRKRPAHLPHDHPDRPPAEERAKLRRHLASMRWAMMGSFTLLFLITPMLPEILRGRLGLGLIAATGMAASIDAARVAAFVVMQWTSRWRGSVAVVVATVLAIPVGFYAVLLSGELGVVLAGALLFGATNGVVYFAGLYYAMELKNASVDAGGQHEGLVGVSLSLGPGMGLLSRGLTPIWGATGGILAATGPLVAGCAFLGLWPLMRRREPGPAPPVSVPEPATVMAKRAPGAEADAQAEAASSTKQPLSE